MRRRLGRVNMVVVVVVVRGEGNRPEKEVRVIGCHSPLKYLAKSGLRKNEVLNWSAQEEEAPEPTTHYFNSTIKGKGWVNSRKNQD